MIGYGITSTLDASVVSELAPAVERAGLRTLWVNHPGAEGNALATMAVAARATTTLRIASGVIPMDLVPATDVVARVRELDLPTDRLVIGIGAHRPPSPVTTVREAARTITDGLGIPVVVGALGPRMRRIGAREASGILLNWLTPDAAREAAADRDRDIAADRGGGRGTGGAGADDSELALYVRCAFPSAHERLRQEADKYAAIPTYAANFERLGFDAIDSVVLAEDAPALRTGLEPYARAVDEVVVRAVTADDTLAEHLELVDALAAGPDGA
ncbi:hypothetical protein GCM10023169_27960 [Georgenia halophila]|uniref:Luciferase-like domain-containing protein n=1 Tax=Georgenia halophila TaxID=620889 RepID=A0ABP8LE93_9MICO